MKTSDRLIDLIVAGNPAAAPLIASHLAAARRQARWYEARYPGHDVEPRVMQALYLAAYSYTPGKNTFYRWFKSKLRGQIAGLRRPPRVSAGSLFRYELRGQIAGLRRPPRVSAGSLPWLDLERLPAPNPNEQVGRDLLESLAVAMTALTPLEHVVVRRRYGLDSGRPEGLRQVGDDLGYTHEGIRKTQQRAIGKLRGHLRTGGYQDLTA
jgi:hypothetical protein